MLSMLVLAAGAAPIVKPEVVSASLFKNGYAMVVRKFDLKGPVTVVRDLPNPALGTFWMNSSGNVKIRRIVVTNEMTEVSVNAVGFDAFLRANLNKTAEVKTVNLGTVVGKVLSLDGEFLMMEVAGKHTVFSRVEIRSVAIEDATTKTTAKVPVRGMRIEADGTGTVYMMGLERGLTWVPGYSIDISNEKTARLSAKATIINDLASFKQASLSLVTGFPNLPMMYFQEPLLSGQSFDQFAGMLNSIGGGGGGGFAGQSGRREMMMQNMAPAADAGWAPLPAVGEQTEDLFFYKISNINLNQSDRGFYMLFDSESEFNHLYTLDFASTGPVNSRNSYQPLPDGVQDVWHTIRFKNSSKQPLTTGAASIYKDGNLIGQDQLMYSSPGAEVSLKLNKALDIRAEGLEVELERLSRNLILPNNSAGFDLVSIEGTIELQNRKSEKVEMRITKPVVGEVVSTTDNGSVRKDARGLRDVNPQSVITWKISLAPGEKKTVTYRYKFFLQVF
jgi:hypothetical protein